MKDGLAVIDYSKGEVNVEAVETCPVEVIHHYAYQDPITWQPPAKEALKAAAQSSAAASTAAKE